MNECRKFREKHGLTQAQLAKLLGYAVKYVASIDNGNAKINAKFLWNLNQITEKEISEVKNEN